MNLAYIGKTTFNINGMTIHFTFGITLNKNSKELKILSHERCDTWIKIQDVFANSNLLTSHTLCLNETNIENIHDNQEKNNLFDKFENLSSYNQHGMTMHHDKTMFLSKKHNNDKF